MERDGGRDERRTAAGKDPGASTGGLHIRVESLGVSYGEREILRDVDLSVSPGEVLVVMGRSGCGKTTLLKTLIGLVRPDRGRVEVLGRDITAMDEDTLDDFRERIGMLFQFGALINSFSVGENVLLPLRRRVCLDEELAAADVEVELGLPAGHEWSVEATGKTPVKKAAGLWKESGISVPCTITATPLPGY